MSRAVIRCQSCRHQILDTFAALTGVSIRPLRQPNIQSSNQAQRHTQRSWLDQRSFSSSTRYLNTQPPEDEPSHTTSPPPSSQPNQPIPWYIEVETPTPPAPINPLLALQDLPPLPQNPPTILSPILNHLSTSIGLDNLSLIDLRSIHPPPALGANLIMIIGTARSYKHLNTSADRFCRWLRSIYKLRPYADGLLGRNELKLKLRRKARRQKLAQSVGNTVMGQEGGGGADDGITTGWVCVNLGSLDEKMMAGVDGGDVNSNNIMDSTKGEGGAETKYEGDSRRLTPEEQEDLTVDEEEEYVNPEDDGYTGFGSKNLSPKIVVQMFTEEKRAEMDLEGLWDFRKGRKSQKKEKADAEDREKLSNTDTEEGEFRPWTR